MLLACAIPRVAALVAWRDPPATLYSRLAVSLADAHRYAIDGISVTHIEPFYPATLALGRLLFGARAWSMLIVQLLLAALAGVALFSFTRDRLGTRSAWMATLLYACSPYLVRQSASFMEITVATALLIAAAWRMRNVRTPGRAMEAGVLFGALVLTRVSFVPIALGALVLVWRTAGARRAVLAGAVAAACVFPWMIHNRSAGGSMLPPRIGENLFVSTSDWAWAVVPRINVDVLVAPTNELVERDMAARGITAYSMADRDRLLFSRALDYAWAHPLATLGLKLRNAAYVLQPRLLPFSERRGSADIVGGRVDIPPQVPRPLAVEFLAGAFQACLLVGGAIGLWRRRDRLLGEDAFLVLTAASVLAVNVVFFPTSRLLAPATFVLMFYTAAAAPGGPR